MSMCSNRKVQTAGGSLLVDTLILEGNLLLPSQVEQVSALDLIISLRDIYPRVWVLRIWLRIDAGILLWSF